MRRKELFQINEVPVPLVSWSPEDTDTLTGLQQPARQMTHDLFVERAKLRDMEEEHRKTTKSILLDVVDCIEGFDRVFDSIERKSDLVTPQMKKWIANFQAVRRRLESNLERHGVRKVEDVGTEFDPEKHEIYDTIVDPGKPDGEIVEVVGNGYTWGGKTLRDPRVIVVRNSATEFDPHQLDRKTETSES